jgi:tetratricopeptide (TPR) repeat protein
VSLARGRFFVVSVSLAASLAVISAPLCAQSPGPAGVGTGLAINVKITNFEIHLKTPAGAPPIRRGIVSVVSLVGKTVKQADANSDHILMYELPQTEYNVHVTVPGYQPAVLHVDARTNLTKLDFELQPMSTEDAAFATQLATLPSKAQKEMGKAMAALRDSQPAKAQSHLDALQRLAPNSAEVNYLLGLYASDTNDAQHAKSYWNRTLELDPKHLRALFAMSEIALHENNIDEALQLSRRAVEADPSSWRAHAVLAGALSEHHDYDQALAHAQRALELGHAQAEVMEPFLASLLARDGEKDRAMAILQSYLHEHPADDAAQKELASITSGATTASSLSVNDSAVASAATALPPVNNWLPPDVDEKMPPVEKAEAGEKAGPGAACDIATVVAGVGSRVQELVGNVDRYTATESLYHETINKWGTASSTETRKFNYLASIGEIRPGYFDVEEYRDARGAAVGFPEGIATLGLPSMALLFHPHNAESFDVVCEGLTHWDGVPVWQVHFRQRPDKPNTMRSYREGAEGQSRPVAMKGRAWIAVDSYQLVRLETDLIAPLPEIQLYADHTIIDYGPVHFRGGSTELWLPTSGEVFFHWKNHRIHRRHTFDKFLLFSVDDKQKISAPKGVEKTAENLTDKPVADIAEQPADTASGKSTAPEAALPNPALPASVASPVPPETPPHSEHAGPRS